MAEPTQEPNGKITTRQFYDALIQQNNRMDEMERRIMSKLDKLTESGSPALVERVKSLEEETDVICAELEQVKKLTYSWNGVNSALSLIAGLLGLQWRQ